MSSEPPPAADEEAPTAASSVRAARRFLRPVPGRVQKQKRWTQNLAFSPSQRQANMEGTAHTQNMCLHTVHHRPLGILHYYVVTTTTIPRILAPLTWPRPDALDPCSVKRRHQALQNTGVLERIGEKGDDGLLPLLSQRQALLELQDFLLRRLRRGQHTRARIVCGLPPCTSHKCCEKTGRFHENDAATTQESCLLKGEVWGVCRWLHTRAMGRFMAGWVHGCRSL